MLSPNKYLARSPVRQKGVIAARVSQSVDMPAPTGGWDAVSPIANMPKDRAIVLDNWFPTPIDVRMRRGFSSFATSLGSGVVETVMPYNAPVNSDEKFFAAANSIIYDITSGGAGSSSVTGLTNNRWQYVNFTTTGGHFLWCCNGADAPRTYEASAGWATPSLTITTYSSTDIIHVNAHKNRLWFVFVNSTVAGYLAVDSISGTVSNFDFGAQFTKGGYLVATATWTHDGGNGPDDYFVAVSSKGQVAIYQGTDPSSASTWSKVGVFDLGEPIGRSCFLKVAGDLALINADGVVPISRAIGQATAAQAAIALTKNINNKINEYSRDYKSNFGWQFIQYPRGNYVLLNIPLVEGDTQYQAVMNSLTGAWCRFTGQNANCWAIFRDNLYFGGNGGVVYLADTGGQDDGSLITATGQGAYSSYGTSSALKMWKRLRAIITTGSTIVPAVGLSTNYADNATLGTPTTATQSYAAYDSAVYDTGTYASSELTTEEWGAAGGLGYTGSIHFRAQKNTTSDVLVALDGFNVIYESGFGF